MWLLEAAGDDFDGKKLWLRPGKQYLLGRTSNSGENICIPHRTISRKHLRIIVDLVPPGDGTNVESRSTVSIEDYGQNKYGTHVNGKTISGAKYVLTKDDNILKLADYTELFYIRWRPVVLGFSLSKAEIDQGALGLIQERLEPNDIKYTTDHRLTGATHVVSKRRNTSRVLQALINGQLVVSPTFTDAITQSVTSAPNANGIQTCGLEEDFDEYWPDVAKYLPPRTEGPGADQPDEAFAPDARRKEIFDGFTFVFYERKRFEELLSVITTAKGKALLMEVAPQETEIDDFIRYVKSVAGEKGLGEFEDGSEGRGVVVVRYVPPGDDDDARWFLNFYNQVALRLDHRPIESRDLLPAILDVEPMQLRRPLEVESTPREPGTQVQYQPSNSTNTAMIIDDPDQMSVVEDTPPPPYRPPRPRQRAAPKSRFKGFNIDSDSEENEESPLSGQPSALSEASQTMFMTQQSDYQGTGQTQQTIGSLSQRKRPAPERDIMEEVAPTVARIKRMRLEGGRDPLPAVPVAEREEVEEEESDEESEVLKSPSRKKTTRGKSKPAAKPATKPANTVKATSTAKQGKSKKKANADDSGDELLDQYIQAGQEEEAKRQAEEERLRRQLNEGGIDFKEIRDGLDIQTIEIRKPGDTCTLNEEPRRWDPKWNGLKNFKKFRKQGEQKGRPQAKVIVPLVPAKGKDYGLGDEYWLTGREWIKKSTAKAASPAAVQQNQSQRPGESPQSGGAQAKGRTTGGHQFGVASQPIAIGSDSEKEEEQQDPEEDTVDNSQLPDIVDIDRPSRSRKGKAAEIAGSQQSQAARRQQTMTRRTGTATATASAGTKRPAREAPAAEKAPKRRATRADKVVRVEHSEEEDSEDGGLSFRFGKRK